MADNTRKTSNIIHDLATVKEDVSNNSKNIQNNTDAIDNISIPTVGDGQINLEASAGLTLEADSQNATANQAGNTTFKVKADLDYLNTNLNIPVGGVSKIIAGANVTISPTGGTGDVTINAAGGSGGGIPEAPINGKQYGREDGKWTEVTSSTPVVPGDGKIDLSGGTGIDVTGVNATANQTGNTAWSVAVDSTVALKSDIVSPGNGSITLAQGDGIKVSGTDATANQTGDTSWTVETDNDYLNTTLNFAKVSDTNLPISDTDNTVVLASPSANTFTVSTGGSERVKVNSSGMTVISANGANNTSLTSGNTVSIFDIDLSNTVANSAFGIRVDGTYRFYMTSNGNVGIGDTLTGPSQKLAVDGSVGAESYVQYRSGSCGMFFPDPTQIEIHPGSNQVSFISSATQTTVKGPADTDAAIEFGTELLTSRHTPTQPNSIATVQYVDDVLSGGQAPEDTIPGTGANFRWTEKTIEVLKRIDGVNQPNQQVYSDLYGYDGIFTDGLHWTPDGHNWYTSDSSKLSPDPYFLVGYQRDRGRVTKGQGNEYLAANYISNDMKSWRRILSSYGEGPVFLGGEIYSNNGQAILNRTLTQWDVTGTSFGGDLQSSPYITVASQESGLYSMCVNPTDGTAYWNAAVEDGYPSGYTKISAIADGEGALDCLFSERMQKWMVVGSDKFWITDIADIAVANWTEMDLPTASNWNRIVDDGGSISLLNTADNASVVLYCIEPSGPATTSDWSTTVSIDNRGYVGFAGTNGRTIASMASANVTTDVDGVIVLKTVFYYSVGGDLRLERTQTTATLPLGTPVDTGFGNRSTRKLLTTQKDANEYFAEEMAKRAVVVTLSQAEYDAIPADEIDDSTLYLIN